MPAFVAVTGIEVLFWLWLPPEHSEGVPTRAKHRSDNWARETAKGLVAQYGVVVRLSV